MVQDTKTAEDIILEEGFVAGFASIMQGIQEIQDYATDAIFPTDACSSHDEELSVTSTAYSLTDASTATDKSLRKSVSWFDDEVHTCNVEVELCGTEKKNKKFSFNLMPSGKRGSRKSRKAGRSS